MKDTISFYSGISPKPIKNITWQEAIEQVQRGDHKEIVDKARSFNSPEQYRQFKKSMPGVTFCGSFNGNRDKKHVLTTTGFIIPDLDYIEDVDKVMALLIQDEKIWFAFRSPSGKGIKCGLRSREINNDDDIKRFYFSVERYFKEIYNITIDSACKDISRLTFMSYDKNLWTNPKPYFFNIKAWTPEQTFKPREIENNIDARDLKGKEKYAWKVLESCCDEIRQSQPGRQHAVRLKMSRLVGGYMGYLNEQEAIDQLRLAVESSGAKNLSAAMKTITDGIEHGKQFPIHIEDNIKNSVSIWSQPYYNESNACNGSNACNDLSHHVTPCNGNVTDVTPSKNQNTRFAGNLTSHIEQFIQENQGSFTNADLDREFGIIHPLDKNLRRQVVTRLQKKNYIRKDRRVSGKYHIMENDIEWIDLESVEEESFPLGLPSFFSPAQIKIPPKCVCVVAGTSNAGKTAFMLNILKENLDRKYNLLYIMSEMGASEYKQRVSRVTDNLKNWNKRIKATSKSSGFDGPIALHNPDGLTVVDFLEEVDGEYYKITSDIRAIYDSLDTGVAFIALQKHTQANVGRGGEGTTEKARLYLTIDTLVHQPQCTISAIKIIKAKDFEGDNPNGKEIHVKIFRGSEIEPITDWIYCNKAQREQYINKYQHMIETGSEVPASGDQEVMFRYLLKDGSYGNLRRKDVEKWEETFKNINVQDVLFDLAEWAQNNPKWTRSGWFFSLADCLQKENEKPPF